MTNLGLAYLQLRETQRANLRKEALTHAANVEAHRTNVANEAIKSASLEETARANRANEGLTGQQLAEMYRSNTAKEQENKRHNIESESLSLKQLDHYKDQLTEQRRANLVSESETQRHNLASEANQKLSSMAQFNNAQTNYAKSFSEIWKNVFSVVPWSSFAQ